MISLSTSVHVYIVSLNSSAGKSPISTRPMMFNLILWVVPIFICFVIVSISSSLNSSIISNFRRLQKCQSKRGKFPILMPFHLFCSPSHTSSLGRWLVYRLAIDRQLIREKLIRWQNKLKMGIPNMITSKVILHHRKISLAKTSVLLYIYEGIKMKIINNTRYKYYTVSKSNQSTSIVFSYNFVIHI